MEYYLFIFISVLYYINCAQFLEYYTNYTFTFSNYDFDQQFYFYPHYEVGTTTFIINIPSNSKAIFYVYDQNKNQIDFILPNLFPSEIIHDLKVPSDSTKPSILILSVFSAGTNFQYYIYLYNQNYNIPLSLSNYNFYQIGKSDIEINYEAQISSNDKYEYINFETKFQFPELNDSIYIILENENNGTSENYIFNNSLTSLNIELKKNIKYKINLKCQFYYANTYQTAILIYFTQKQKNKFISLVYKEDNIISSNSILENNEFYFIDNINLIDESNSYYLKLTEKNSQLVNKQNLKIQIYIKKYSTYDFNFITNNAPSLDKEYDEYYLFDKENSFNFKFHTDRNEANKTILICAKINYKYQSYPLYEFSIEKMIEKKQLEFKSYLVNYYTKYEFSPLYVDNNDTIIISANYSNALFPKEFNNSRILESFYDGFLYISLPDKNLNKNQIKISYNDENITLKNENDKILFEVYKLSYQNNDTFQIININSEFSNKAYYVETKNNISNFFYLKIDKINPNEYYLLYEPNDINSFLTIEEMPVNIISFSKNKRNDEIKLLSNNNEYFIKIQNANQEYDLFNIILIKNENIFSFNIAEGQIKILTFPSTKNKISLDINLNSKNLKPNKSYINLKIPTNKIIGNLYIQNNRQNNSYLLNNSGINIYYLNDTHIHLNISNINNIKGNIPILIKYGLNIEIVKSINDKKNYEFKSGEVGIFKFDKYKFIKLHGESEKNNLKLYYYLNYLPKDISNNDINLLSPEIFKIIEFNDSKIDVRINTLLDLQKTKKVNSNWMFDKDISYDLYLIFSFSENVKIINEDKSENLNIAILIVLIFIPIIIIILVVIIIFIKCKKRKKGEIIEKLYHPQNNEYNNENNNNKEDENYNYINNKEAINYSNRNDSKNYLDGYDIDLPAPLPID